MVDLRVNLYNIQLKNPVMPAAGPPVKDGKAAQRASAGGAGAIVTKTISLSPARVPRPNMSQVKGGFINCELWSELTLEQWLEKEYPLVVETGLPVIAGLGYTAEEISKLAPLVEPFADILELSTHYLGNDPTPMIESIKAAREVVDIPVMVKLSPQIDIKFFARAAEEAGADGLVLINSFGPTLDIDPESGRALLGNKDGYGWLSGQAIFPLALRAVFAAAQSVKIPILGVGGISSGMQAVKIIMAGATAVQVCTAAILKGPDIYRKIAEEIEGFLASHHYQTLADIRGLALRKSSREANYQKLVPQVDKERCNGCQLCVISCVYQAIELKSPGDPVEIDTERCAGCGLCISRCNYGALSL